MSEREARILQAHVERAPTVTLRGTAKWVSVWIAGLVLLGLIGYGLASLEPWLNAGGLLGGLVMVAGALCILAGVLCVGAICMLISSHLGWSRFEREFRRRDVPEIRAALRDATVRVTRVRATSVVTIEEYEDEGAGFIFDVENGQLLFLKGQGYWPAEEAMAWPNSEFEIVRTAVGDRWVGIFCHGAPLTPTQVLQSAECKEDIVWAEREDVVEASMDEFVRSIRTAT
jgi:hypothetical protein